MNSSSIQGIGALVAISILMLMTVKGVNASVDTNGPNGINSTDLPLTGSGISIGHVRPNLPGIPMLAVTKL